MNNALPAYEVLRPIAYKGDRIEKGSIIHMTEAEAKNIGEEYLKSTEPVAKTTAPSEPKEPEEAKPSDEQKPAEETETHAAETEAKTDENKPSEENAPAQTENKQNETI